MEEYSRKIVSIQPRNIRYLFVVENSIKIDSLLDLCGNLQKYWGGRLFPIIPAYKGIIDTRYFPLAQHFDPDYVIYTSSIDIKPLESILCAKEYIRVGEINRHDINKVDARYLFESSIDYVSILYEDYLYKLKDKTLYDFVRLNFGFYNNASEPPIDEIKHARITIDQKSLGKIIEPLFNGKIYFNSLLSTRNVKFTPIKGIGYEYRSFKIIIANDNNQFEDIITYWNSALLYKDNSSWFNSIYTTTNQLNEFLKLPNAYLFLYYLIGNNRIPKIQSVSIPQSELENITNTINTNDSNKYFKVKIKETSQFPFEIESFSHASYYEERASKQIVNDYNDILYLPELSFSKNNNVSGKWAVDTAIEESTTNYKKPLLLPEKSKNIFFDESSRVNKMHNISLFIGNNTKHVEFSNQSNENILRSLLFTNGNKKQNSFDDFATSDDGLKINALIKLFGENFVFFEHIFCNKFWLNIFRNKPVLKDDETIKQSKGIVSLQDLEKEYRNLFVQEGLEFEDWYIKNDHHEVKEDLGFLVSSGVYFMGFKIRCNNCSSNHWYELSELSNTMKCRGCLGSIRPSIESRIYYKLNDTVKNSLISGAKSNNNLHGNYTVLMTLLSQQAKAKQSFYYLPSQNYYIKDRNKHQSDIDLIFVRDGRLVIGEAKNSVKEFSQKEMNQLILWGNEINPDELMLAFNEGNESSLTEKISYIHNALENKNISIVPYKIFEIDYRYRNLSIARSKVAIKK